MTFGRVVIRHRSADEGAAKGERWHHAQHYLLKSPPTDGTAFDGHRTETVGYGPSIYVRLPCDDRDLYEFLLTKYEKERKQLRGLENRVILLDASGLKSNVHAMNLDLLNDALGQRVFEDATMSAVWIASRGWSEYLRPIYRAVTVSNPKATVPLPADFVERVNEREEKVDALTGDEFDWQPTRRFEDP